MASSAEGRLGLKRRYLHAVLQPHFFLYSSAHEFEAVRQGSLFVVNKQTLAHVLGREKHVT